MRSVPAESCRIRAIDPESFDTLTFDCYGTLIDWETGILRVLRRSPAATAQYSDEQLLAMYGAFEAEAERGDYVSYREILRGVARGFALRLGVPLPNEAEEILSSSVPDWPPFPDTQDALVRLGKKYRLVILSNIDRDLIAQSVARIDARIDLIITAEEARAYKPSPEFFDYALPRVSSDLGRVVHVAQSKYHDIAPVTARGMRAIWVNRRHDRPGSGATPPVEATPTLTVRSLGELADTLLPL